MNNRLKLSDYYRFIEDSIFEIEKETQSIPSINSISKDILHKTMIFLKGRMNPNIVKQDIDRVYYSMYG